MASITHKDYRIIITGTVSASTKITDDQVWVQSVRWTGATAAANLARLTDKDGDVVAYFCADTPGTAGLMTYSIEFPFGHPFNGLYIDDLDAGEMIIYKVPR